VDRDKEWVLLNMVKVLRHQIVICSQY